MTRHPKMGDHALTPCLPCASICNASIAGVAAAPCDEASSDSIQDRRLAIRYAIQYRCKVRDTVSDAQLLNTIEARHRAQVAPEAMRSIPLTDTGQADSEQRCDVGDPLAEAVAWDELAGHCNGCPANLGGSAFGCAGALHYPITGAAEKWLCERLPADIDSAPGLLLVQLIRQRQFDGKDIDSARRRIDLYESAAPAKRSWGSWRMNRVTITSSQVLQLLLGAGDVGPERARLVTSFLGYLDEPADPLLGRDCEPRPGDADQVIEFKHLLRCIAFAGAQGVPVSIDG